MRHRSVSLEHHSLSIFERLSGCFTVVLEAEINAFALTVACVGADGRDAGHTLFAILASRCSTGWAKNKGIHDAQHRPGAFGCRPRRDGLADHRSTVPQRGGKIREMPAEDDRTRTLQGRERKICEVRHTRSEASLSKRLSSIVC